MEADRKYEDAEYATAIELYTKAIELQPLDKATQLKHLYGNRSAACFMDHCYAECVFDCLEVIRLDPTNTKMISRAARSAATMGDLTQAIKILEKTPSEHLTDAISIELSKFKSGLDIYRRAERGFGTSDGDERYRMLVAQFSDTVPFRVRYAESLMEQKQYAKVVEALEVVASSARTSQLCKIMATCLYQSGFEFFERARLCLAKPSKQDSDCEELLKLIEIVEDGKQKGNNAFATKDFSSAVMHYTEAIRLAIDNDQILRILYCNRAAAHKELGNYRDGINDCTNAILLDKDFCKAYARRARCYQHLGDNFAAVQDFKKALEYDPSNRELAKELKSAEQSLSRESELEKDLYYQLGLSRTATDKEIKTKYRELSLRWHPDKCIGMSTIEKDRSEHKFKIIGEAYATLINPSKRRDYDLKMDRERLSHLGMYGGFSSTYSNSGEYNRNTNRHRTGPGGFW
ncbi:unnamed protein product [Phytomonas sp. Hart1]|nr:unnamed protein product [Phytomonas sp. Hart1]|eukprot:CCW66542.1 unnamed protein product [Phytomonas sp. isolate Hart1]